MAGLVARKTATHWVVPGAAAAALHALTLYIGVSSAPPATASVSSAAPGLMFVELPAESPEVAREAEPPIATVNPVATAKPAQDASPRVGARTLEAAHQTAPQVKSTTKRPATETREHSPASPLLAGAAAPVNERNTSASADPLASATDAPAAAHEVAAHDVAAHDVAAHRLAGALHPSSTPLAAKPRLLSSGSACQGVLHSTALGTPTNVTLMLHVGKDGSASATAVRADASAHVPGLELAAQRCAQRLRFSPARSHDGAAVAASSIVKLTFSNHYTATLPRSNKPRHGAI